MIDEVTAQVVEQSARFVRVASLAPARFGRRTPPIETRLESEDRTERVVGQKPPNGKEVAIPSPILEDGEHQLSAPRFLDQGPAFLGRRREWLVDDDGDARLECLSRKRCMRTIRRRHDHEVQVARHLPQSIRGLDDPCPRMIVLGLSSTRRVPRYDRVEP